nr:hypothetical protein Saspl_047920 [Ipomoea batatas]
MSLYIGREASKTKLFLIGLLLLSGREAMEEILFRDCNGDQPSCRELEVYSLRSNFSVHPWSGCSRGSLLTSPRTHTSRCWVLYFTGTWSRQSLHQRDSIFLHLSVFCLVDIPSFHLQEQKDLHGSNMVQGPGFLSCLPNPSDHYFLFYAASWSKLSLL